MKKVINIILALVFLLGFAALPVRGEVDVQTVQITVVRDTITGPGDVTLRYLLINPAVTDDEEDDFEPFDPLAVLMLFPGGSGRLFLSEGQQNIGSTNFLVRTRYHFAAEGFVVAVIDAASDFLAHSHSSMVTDGFKHGSGLRGHRFPSRPDSLHGGKYKIDLQTVIDDLRDRFPDLPLWAVGTSRGTNSAAVAAAEELDDPPDGLVLTASLTGPSSNGDLDEVDLEEVKVPTLIVTNKDDECSVTKPEDSKDLKMRLTAAPKVGFRRFKGGITPLSSSCGSLSGHGFFGIEQKVIEKIAKFIKKATD